MRAIAKAKNGKCLSKEYINENGKLHWRCNAGHEWDAIGMSVKRGSWCPYCAHNAKLTIEDMQELAKSRGGVCLSKRFINQNKLKFKCAIGHTWVANSRQVNHGTWCPMCGRKKIKYISK